jgi:hypothetical protein
MAEVSVTRLQDRMVRLDGHLSALYEQIQTMGSDGVLERVVSTVPEERSDGTFSVQVLLRPALPSGEPAHAEQKAAESPSPKAPCPTPSWWRSEGTQRAVALAGIVLGSCGLAIGAVWGITWLVSWVWSLIAPYLVSSLLIIVLSVAGLVFLRRRSFLVADPIPASSLAEPVTRPQGSRTGLRRARGTGMQVIPQDEPLPPGRVVEKRHWLTGRVVSRSVAAQEEFQPEDRLTRRWLDTMRSKHAGQSIGKWRGGYNDINDPTVGQVGFDDDRCAVGWLLELNDPGGWHPRDNRGKKHRSYKALEAKYGKRFIRDVIRMNDRGVPLKKIARRIEPKLRKQGHIR